MNMEDISNDGLNSDLEDHDDDEDEEDFNSFRNRNLNDEDIIFNQADTAHDTSFNSTNNKRKKINSTKYSKKRKCRTTFTKSQLITLENEFIKSNFVSNDRIDLLIDLTGLDSRIIKNWFKNKRSRVLADSKTTNPCTKSISDTHSLSSSSPFSIKAEKLVDLTLNQTSIFDSNSPILLNNNQNQLYVQTSLKEIDKLKSPYLTFLSNNKALELEHDNFQQPTVYHNISADANHSSSNGLLNIISNQENENKQIMNKIYSPPITSVKQQLPVKTEILKRQNLNLLELKDSNCNVCSRFSKLFCICNVSKTALNRLYKNCSGFNSFLFETNHNKRYQYERNQRLLASENESKIFEVL